MNIHEYQAKDLLAGFGVAVPRGSVAFSADSASYVVAELGGDHWAVKAQIHAGARGKAGGVRLCRSHHAVAEAAGALLGKALVTAQTRMLVACRAYGLRPIDGPFGDFGDAAGFRSAARRVAVLGYEGKWAIHPSQIALANEVFTPTAAEIDKAQRIIAAMETAAREGRGAVSLDGRLIDLASIRMAESLLGKARAAGLV